MIRNGCSRARISFVAQDRCENSCLSRFVGGRRIKTMAPRLAELRSSVRSLDSITQLPNRLNAYREQVELQPHAPRP